MPMTSSARPVMRVPRVTGARNLERTPAWRSTATGRLPSAFITTTAQLPLRRSDSIRWVPGPCADTAQKSCALGSAGAWEPEVVR